MAQRGRTSVFTWERTRHRPPCDRRRRDPQTLDRPRPRPRPGRSTMRAAAERILEAVR
ncbi:hypothetical protein [Planomonospora algeriensis]